MTRQTSKQAAVRQAYEEDRQASEQQEEKHAKHHTQTSNNKNNYTGEPEKKASQQAINSKNKHVPNKLIEAWA